MSEYVLNSLGAMQGGVLASLVEATAARDAGDGFETVDLQLWYLALAKEGPVVARATTCRRSDRFVTADVAVDDAGAGRRTTVARTSAVRW